MLDNQNGHHLLTESALGMTQGHALCVSHWSTRWHGSRIAVDVWGGGGHLWAFMGSK